MAHVFYYLQLDLDGAHHRNTSRRSVCFADAKRKVDSPLVRVWMLVRDLARVHLPLGVS